MCRYPDEIKDRVDAAVGKMAHIQNEIKSRRMEVNPAYIHL